MEVLAETLTPYERLWQKLPPNHRIAVGGRTSKYDPLTGLLYFPTMYEQVAIQNAQDEAMPNNDWIATNFLSFVKGEFGGGEDAKVGGESVADLEKIQFVDTDLSQLAKTYLENCESELVYSGYLKGITDSGGLDMGLQMYNILCDPILGNRETRKYVELDFFRTLIEPAVKNKSRLLLIFPGLPFKDQNIFRTACPASHVDMADLAFMVRLHVLSLALYQVHPYGVDWIVLSDGTAYANILGVEEDEASRYASKLRQYRAQLNLQYTVHILDLRDIARNLLVGSGRGEGHFTNVLNHISSRLPILEENDSSVKDRFLVLVRGMKWNRSWKHFFEAHGLDAFTAWRLIQNEAGENLGGGERKLWDELDAIAYETARAYASFNLALKFVRFYDSVFPGAIKATSHPKSKELGVPRLGEVTPWNGVCLAKDQECRPDSFQSVPLYKLTRDSGHIRCYRDSASSYAAFYSVVGG